MPIRRFEFLIFIGNFYDRAWQCECELGNAVNEFLRIDIIIAAAGGEYAFPSQLTPISSRDILTITPSDSEALRLLDRERSEALRFVLTACLRSK